MKIRQNLLWNTFASVFFSFMAMWAGISCQNGASSDDSNWEYFGDSITLEGATDVSELPALMKGKQMAEFKLSGTIVECCQKKGCFVKLDMGAGQMLRVGFKDYAFFMPLESSGSRIVMQGVATYDTTTVDALRHYAEDAGKSKDEIAAITEPEVELVFEANGVRLRQ
jgi:hypothetical protein